MEFYKIDPWQFLTPSHTSSWLIQTDEPVNKIKILIVLVRGAAE
jgi:hypothetical protein